MADQTLIVSSIGLTSTCITHLQTQECPAQPLQTLHCIPICCDLQVRMTVVLDHVLDTVQHLLKKKVALERAVDPDTPDIIADGSRIVQARHCSLVSFAVLLHAPVHPEWPTCILQPCTCKATSLLHSLNSICVAAT